MKRFGASWSSKSWDFYAAIALSKLSVPMIFHNPLQVIGEHIQGNRLGKAPFVVDATRLTNHMNRIAGPVGQPVSGQKEALSGLGGDTHPSIRHDDCAQNIRCPL
jgi:hypothetical protein